MRSIPTLVVLALVSIAAPSQVPADDGAPYVSAGPTHRVMLDPRDPSLALLIDRGAIRHIEDYGSFLFVIFDEAAFGGRAALGALEGKLHDEQALIGFHGAVLDTADPVRLSSALAAIPAALHAAAPFGASTGRELRIVQFIGPVRDAWLDALRSTGARVVSYMASNAFIVAVDAPSIARLDALGDDPVVQWMGSYEPFFRLAPELRGRAVEKGAGMVDVTIQLIADEESYPVLLGLAEARFEELRPPSLVLEYVNVHVRVPDSLLAPLASHPAVFGIETLAREELLDEAQNQIMAGNVVAGGGGPSAPGYLAWLSSKGFASGQFGFVVDVVDDGIDRGSTTDVNVEFRVGGVSTGASRIVYNNNYTSDALADGGGGHGNLNASIIGGYNGSTGTAFEDAGGYNYGLGVCPFVSIGNTKVFSNGTGSTFTQPTVTRLAAAYNGGARISSNSWGYTAGNNYNADSQAHDVAVRDALSGTAGNQEMAIVFAAGNDGSAANTVRPPGTAKNMITVGAGENNRQTGTDGCAISNTGANNANDIISFSSRGPTSDARKKPEIVAPGTHVQGAASRSLSYNGSGVCNQFWPAGQTLYCWSSGTSHSTPAVAGAAALVRQFFVNQGFGTPSPAMIKAWLMASARYLTGTGANDTLWSNNQGIGGVDLGRAFNGVAAIRTDQAQVFGTTGQTYTVSGSIATASQPFRVALTWTDTPGPTTGNAFVNNLDLEVTVNGTLYRGNVFSGATSIAGGTADIRNNAEMVFLPAGTTGSFTVVVRATNIAGDGVPGNADTTDQDFALVISNATTAATPDFALSATPSSQTVTQGQSASYTVSNAASGGFASTVTLSVTPAISGVSYVISPNPQAANGSSTLMVSTTASATTGTHVLTISGVGGGLTRTTTVTLVINAAGGGGNQVKTYAAAPAVAIPDNNATGVTSSISVPISQTITSVAVSVNVTHTWIGDLRLRLTAPNGTQRLLHNQTGGSADNIVTTYAILTTPAESLASFNGLNTAGTWSLNAADLAAADVGTLNSWTITFNGEKSATPNVAIPDNNATGVTNTLNYTATGTVASVKVRVSVTHTYKGDLVVTLIAPDGTQVLLHNRTGGATDNVITEFPDLTAPAQSLAALVGKSIAGNWSLKVQDLAAADVGTFGSWTLSLTAQ